MSVLLRELPCNWRGVQSLKTTDAVSWPTPNTLEVKGIEPDSEMTTVFIKRSRLLEINVVDMRDWMKEFIYQDFKMFNRFHYETFKYNIEREYLGLCVRFQSTHDAMYFKMCWF
jgi:hypothetical protein